jgi:hypothetical protein
MRLEMAEDEPKQHRVVVDHRMPMETLATVRADLTMVVEIGGVAQALKENCPEIVVKLPTWWPRALFWLFTLWVSSIIAYQGMVSLKGLTLGYNIETCQKLMVKGVELSNCLKLTKP